jgi:hypothetical protein
LFAGFKKFFTGKSKPAAAAEPAPEAKTSDAAQGELRDTSKL